MNRLFRVSNRKYKAVPVPVQRRIHCFHNSKQDVTFPTRQIFNASPNIKIETDTSQKNESSRDSFGMGTNAQAREK